MDSHIKIRLQVKEVGIPKGKRIKLKPIIDRMSNQSLSAPGEISKSMGIPFIPDHVEISIFDEEGFKKACLKKGKSREAEYKTSAGRFFPGENEILINADTVLQNTMDALSSVSCSAGALEAALGMSMLECLYHELVHLNHYLYDPKSLETSLKWQPKTRLGVHMNYLLMKAELLRKTAIFEGVAIWVDRYLVGNQIRFYTPSGEDEEISASVQKMLNEPKLQNPSLGKKLVSLLKDPYSLGHWFLSTIAGLVNTNPIKLVLDNPPKSIFELFNPEQYVKRLEKERKLS